MEIVNPHSIEHRTHFEFRFPAAVGSTSASYGIREL